MKSLCKGDDAELVQTIAMAVVMHLDEVLTFCHHQGGDDNHFFAATSLAIASIFEEHKDHFAELVRMTTSEHIKDFNASAEIISTEVEAMFSRATGTKQ